MILTLNGVGYFHINIVTVLHEARIYLNHLAFSILVAFARSLKILHIILHSEMLDMLERTPHGPMMLLERFRKPFEGTHIKRLDIIIRIRFVHAVLLADSNIKSEATGAPVTGIDMNVH